ncbi:MAG: complement resistance protein TraT [Thermodesulfobacteriota bacterium]
MLSKYGRLGIAVAALAALALLAGCAATTTAIRYKDLDVQTKMSHTIFLDPVAASERSVFVQIRNTSDKPFDIQGEVMSALMAKGYRVVQDPAQAHYILQANVLAVGRTDQSALENATALGYGGVAAGAAAGALLGGSRPWQGAAVGGLAAGAAEVVAGSLVQVVWYAAVTDVQISERVKGAVSEEFTSTLKQGSAQTYTKQRTASTSNVKKYQTRIASSARKVSLEFVEAEPYLRQGLVQAISGLF